MAFVIFFELFFFFCTLVQDVTVDYIPEPRYLYLEGARDVAVLEAMLESSSKEGASVLVKNL